MSIFCQGAYLSVGYSKFVRKAEKEIYIGSLRLIFLDDTKNGIL
jgi:hypothetical protein